MTVKESIIKRLKEKLKIECQYIKICIESPLELLLDYSVTIHVINRIDRINYILKNYDLFSNEIEKIINGRKKFQFEIYKDEILFSSMGMGYRLGSLKIDFPQFTIPAPTFSFNLQEYKDYLISKINEATNSNQ